MFDLILLDMVIPGTDDRWQQGLDLLKRVRRDLGVKAPVLMMSGGWDTRKETEALSEGAVGYLHKPFGLRELDTSRRFRSRVRPSRDRWLKAARDTRGPARTEGEVSSLLLDRSWRLVRR